MKKIVIGLIVFMIAFIIFYALVKYEVISLPTMNDEDKESKVVASVEDLEDGSFYVWHHPQHDISEDLNGPTDMSVFKKCPIGSINWKKNKNISHTMWFSSIEDNSIPTLYPGDRLIYISSTKVPFKGIEWERFADYGYTIGVANLEEDAGGHFYISNNMEYGYEGYLNPTSEDVSALLQYDYVDEIFLDKIGNVPVKGALVTNGGTVAGLKKDQEYKCEFYTGTLYQDYSMKANNHVFSGFEEYKTYDYEFLHSNCISVLMPEWLKTGYYMVSGLGIFRYLEEKDVSSYNGLAFDPGLDWNVPLILRDETGLIYYDPSTGIDNRDQYNRLHSVLTEKEEDYIIYDEETSGKSRDEMLFEMSTAPVEDGTDEGAEAYEDFYEDNFYENSDSDEGDIVEEGVPIEEEISDEQD